MSTLDRRAFLRGMLYGLLGAALGWEVEAVAASEAAPAAEEEPFDCTWLCKGDGCWNCRYTDENTHCIKRDAGQVWESPDGGRSWHKTGYYPYSILTEHSICKTLDGGKTWTFTEEGFLDAHWTNMGDKE